MLLEAAASGVGHFFYSGHTFFYCWTLSVVLGLKTQLIWELKRHHIYEYNKKKDKKGGKLLRHTRVPSKSFLQKEQLVNTIK